MGTNIDRYKKDLEALIVRGETLGLALEASCFPSKFEEAVRKADKETKRILMTLPDFNTEYQTWYSEAKVLIKQLLPDRLEDFVGYYQKPKSRKDLSNENYRIEDSLQGLRVTDWQEKEIVGKSAAIPHFRQQRAILVAVRGRFDSSLFDIRQLAQADLFDSELDSAIELVKNGFFRAAGAVVGVLLEKHLSHVAANRGIKCGKKNPSIGDFNDLLRQSSVIDQAQWRFIQHLADIRNLCDHNKTMDPTKDQVNDLVVGVKKITKTVF